MTLASRLSRSLEVTGTDTYRSATYDFLLVIHSNHWPIKIPPMHLTPSLKVFSLEFYNGSSAQTTVSCPYQMWKEFDKVCSRLDTTPECDRETDGRTDLPYRYRDPRALRADAR